MSSESRDQLSSLKKRQSDILVRVSYLETNINSENVLQDQKMSTDLGSPDVCGSVSTISLVSGGAQKLLFRWGHSSCLRGDSHLIIFGGYGGSERHARLNDILELDARDGCVRSLAASGTPAPIMAHTASMVDHKMIVIGGRRSPTCILNTVSVLDLKSLEWKLPEVTGAEFPPRHRHAAAVVGSNIYVQGGLNGTDVLGDLYMLDTTSWTWSVVSCEGMVSSARFSHSLAAFGGKLYIYGGRGRNAVYGDVHVLDLETLVWSEAEVKGTPPSPRYSHTVTVMGHYLLVIGGCPITPQGSELVSLDLVSMSWVRLPICWPSDSLVVRHSATVVGWSLVLVGGGAACFAFGTSFSPTLMIKLEPFLRHLAYPEQKSLVEILHSEELSPDVCVVGKQKLTSWVVKADKDKAKVAKDALKQLKWLDPSRKSRAIYQTNHVAFPILETAVPVLLKGACSEQVDPRLKKTASLNENDKCGAAIALETLFDCGFEVQKLVMPPVSKHRSPQDSLEKSVSALREHGIALPMEEFPKKWERLGDMIILPAGSLNSPVWSSLGEKLWRTIASSLGASRLGRQAAIASTGTRDSQLQLLYGRDGWVEHRENGILYCFDAVKCMFSSGNVSERLRVANMQCRGATVVDLFAGIGYYVLPFLLKAGGKKVYACEWNPNALVALRHNLAVNGIEARCEVIEGDNRITAPEGVADIVSLGLLPSSEGSWHVAVKALRPEGGILLVHENVKDTDEKVWIEYLLNSISTLAASLGRAWDISLGHFERVKWYAPHIRHVVADVCCKEAVGCP
ncbi:unnamed protein product [Calypogeia fissa]